ncbi:MAG: hypothetical protein AABW80_01810 [Nanoarchaeota archaeon]
MSYKVIENLAIKKEKKKKLERVFEITAGAGFIISSLFLSNITGSVIGTSSKTDSTLGLIIASFSIFIAIIYLFLRVDMLNPKM